MMGESNRYLIYYFLHLAPGLGPFSGRWFAVRCDMQ